MKNLSRIIATVLAALIGAMSVVAGIRVLLGLDVPDYHVLSWLVGYNVLLGAFSLIAAYLILQYKSSSRGFSAAILISHASVLLLLLTRFKDVVATDSIKAMAFRLTIWSVILLLTYKTNKNEK